MSRPLRRCRTRTVFLFLGLFLLFPSLAQACRFWVAVGHQVPRDYIIRQLISEEHALKHLGKTYPDGWSVGYYDKGDDIVIRGAKAADYNEEFDDAVRYVANFQPQITMAHLRRASSGCVKGVPDPHPFRITYNGINWLFGHNGGINKKVLMDLIGKPYLKEHPPAVCTENPPDSWIDSELFFIFLMKTVQEHNDHVEEGLLAALRKLYRAVPQKDRYLNFFLTDGTRVWAFRKGNTLFYQTDKKNHVTTVASTVPEEKDGTWQEFPEDTLAVLSMDQPIRFMPLLKHPVPLHSGKNLL